MVFGPLDQNVDQGLLRVLLYLWYDRGSWGWWGWGLDEDDLVVFLGWGDLLDLWWCDVFLFWGWNVNVDVFLDNWGSRGVVVAR